MFVVRDPRFSMTVAESDRPKLINSQCLFRTAIWCCCIIRSTRYRHTSFGKQLERRFISVWKLATRSARRQPRNSYISPDFIVITARRRSTMLPNLYRFQKWFEHEKNTWYPLYTTFGWSPNPIFFCYLLVLLPNFCNNRLSMSTRSYTPRVNMIPYVLRKICYKWPKL